MPAPQPNAAQTTAVLATVQRHLLERRYADALRLCEELAIADPVDAEVQELLLLARHGATAGGLGARERFRLALQLHRSGRLAEAEHEYRAVVQQVPQAAEAHNNLGTVLQARGEHAAACAAFEHALQVRPDYARALVNLGGTLIAAQRPAEAREHLARAVAIEPANAEAWVNLGVAERAAGALAASVQAQRQAIRLRPDHAAAYFNLANALREQHDLAGALEACERSRQLDPRPVGPGLLKAALLEMLGRLDEAVAALDAIDRSQIRQPDEALSLGRLLSRFARLEQAVDVVQRVHGEHPTHAELRLLMARLYAGRGQLQQAHEVFAPLLYAAASAAAWAEYGVLRLRDAEQRDDAASAAAGIVALERAIRMEPERVDDRMELALALTAREPDPRAAEHLEQVLRVQPTNAVAAATLLSLRAAQCDWAQYETLRAVMRDGIERQGARLSSLAVAMQFDDLQLIQRGARQLMRGFQAPDERERPAPEPGRARLRIGYLSPDFRSHPVAEVIAPVIEQHDRSRFEVIGFASQPTDATDIAGRVRAAFDRVVDLHRLAPADFDARIREQQLDLLVDLAGLSSGGRPEVLALRPAPVLISYLGCAATQGAPWIDYILADPFVIPQQAFPYYDEHVVWLPDTFMPGEIAPATAARPTREAAGLPATGFVFCNFNQYYRLNPEAFDAFVRVLAGCPGSVLWLRAANPAVEQRLRARASAQGVAPQRLVFAPFAAARQDHLARLPLADLFLDSLPYNAHTTARDALGAGVPVLTCAGESFAGRVAGSLLTSLDVAELIVQSAQAFHARALALAGDAATLDGLRARIRAALPRSAAFNPALQARQLEAAYLAIHARALAGERPAPLDLRSAAAPPAP
jgi:protein O-GlcNAc transferase